MYRIIKDGVVIATEDKARYTRMQTNGIAVLCTVDKADGIVVDNDHIIPLSEVTVEEFQGPNALARVTAEGAALAQASTDEPPATVGALIAGFEKWAPGNFYEKRYSLFEHEGEVGFTRQDNITAMEHQPPFSAGMEAVYGIRPAPDDFGIYPYRYNMAASEGMRVRDAEGVVWYCYNPVDPLLWTPGEAPAHFRLDEEV